MFIRYFSNIWNKFLEFVDKFRLASRYKAKIVSEHPKNENIIDNEILIVGGIGYKKWAYFKCPCNCNEVIRLCLMKKQRPSWSINLDNSKLPTIYPSVRQLTGCYSHFWIKKGNVIWCKDTGKAFNINNMNSSERWI